MRRLVHSAIAVALLFVMGCSFSRGTLGDEFNADHRIELKGKSLVLQIGETFEAPLTPAYADAFSTANGQISLLFSRNDKGRISGFVFNSAVDDREVKDIEFSRR